MKKKRFFRGCEYPGLMKFVVTMKLTTLLLFLSIVTMATGSYSQNTRFSLNVKDATILQVLEEIERQTEFGFLFKTDHLDMGDRYTVNLKEAKIENVMNEILDDELYSYRVMDRIIVISRRDANPDGMMEQNSQKVSGKVSDSSGLPLPGVTVMVKGTTTGTVTDANGEYTLTNVPEDAILQFSFVGMRTQEVAFDGKVVINVQMEEDAIGLDEVVAIGYSVQKRSNLTGAVSTVNFEKELENRPLTNASQALGGAMTGVWVSQNSGQPGSDGATIRVRGFGTLNNSDPMVLIDGIEGRMSELNPNDIESITVLKDAASAAIYGSKAANGVILVTTKTGTSSGKVKVTYNGYYGLQKMGERFDLISNSADYMEIWNSAMNGGDPKFPDEVVSAFRSGKDPYLYPNTNFIDEVTRVAPITEHNISVNFGSGDVSNYFQLIIWITKEFTIILTPKGLVSHLITKQR